MATQDFSALHQNILHYIFQSTSTRHEDVICIYLNDNIVYTTDKATILRYPSSVMCKSLQADMSESMTNKIVIHDEEGLYTPSAVKVLFTALTVGAASVEHSIFTSYDTLVVPFLAHYLGVDEEETGKQVAAIALAQCAKAQCSVEDINNIILKLIPVAAMHADSEGEKSSTSSFFATFKKLLILRLADQASHSTNLYIYKWEFLSPDDLCTVAQNIKGVTLCTYRCVPTASTDCTCEYVSGLEGCDTLIKIVPSLINDGKRLSIHIKWQEDQPQCYFVSATSNMMSSDYIPATRASCGTWTKYTTIAADPVYIYAWQMRYEVIMAYIQQSCNMLVPEEFRISEHVGMQLDICLRGIIALRSLEGYATTALRYILIETTALMLHICVIPEFSGSLIGYLTSIDMADIMSCNCDVCYAKDKTRTVSYVIDILKFAIIWKNNAPRSKNSDRPTLTDVVAVVRMIVQITMFDSITIDDRSLEEKSEFVNWLTAHAGDELQHEVRLIAKALINKQ